MSTFSKKGRGPEHKFPVPALAYLPDAPSGCIALRARLASFGLQTHGRLGQLTKCDRIRLAVSLRRSANRTAFAVPMGVHA
jgi:hypothetical protein